MKKMKLLSSLFLFASVLTCSGCGGGGSGDNSQMVIEGTLTEAGGAQHSERSVTLRHGEGSRIGDVEICALGQCSTTDDEGQWGFVTPDGFNGGAIELSVNGHGIATSTVVEIPSGKPNVFLELSHVEGGIIEAHIQHEEGEEEHEHS